MITAAATGNYFFYIAADDAARVYLSTTESAANKTEIVSVASFTGFQQWSESAPRRSAAIALQAGQRYYIEVQHREGSSGDHVTVAWKGPGISAITPIVSPSEIVGNRRNRGGRKHCDHSAIRHVVELLGRGGR